MPNNTPQGGPYTGEYQCEKCDPEEEKEEDGKGTQKDAPAMKEAEAEV